MKNVAVILAGGNGSRFGADMPKQFLVIAGKMIIEHTIEAFERHPLIDEIVLVSRADFVDEMLSLAEKNGYRKLRRVLHGGKERYHSSLAAIEAYTDDDDRLLIHDGVRPLVTERTITDCIKALDSYEAVDVAVPATDTIIELSENGSISRIPERRLLRNVQTPQCFRRGTISRAFERALQDKSFFPTDDCSIVYKYLPETPICVVDGDPTNIKITYPEDLAFAERVLRERSVAQS